MPGSALGPSLRSFRGCISWQGERLAGLFTRAPGLVATSLMRRPIGPDGRGVIFTAVDVETTGLEDGDRIVELAAVVFRGDGEILDEYATVVDPVTVSTSTTREIHGLTDEQIAGAPRAEAVLAELWRLSAGTVLVSHNLEFERRFLVHESQRARLPVPAMLSVCTLRTARVQLDGRTFKLKPLYKTATGQWPEDEHTALADARAAAAVLCWMLAQAPGRAAPAALAAPAAGPAVRQRPARAHRAAAVPGAQQ